MHADDAAAAADVTQGCVAGSQGYTVAWHDIRKTGSMQKLLDAWRVHGEAQLTNHRHPSVLTDFGEIWNPGNTLPGAQLPVAPHEHNNNWTSCTTVQRPPPPA